MRSIYDLQNKPGQTKEKFMSNEWSRKYKRYFNTYREYVDAMEHKVVFDEKMKIYKWV